MKAIALNATLKASDGDKSSTEKMLELVLAELRKEGVEGGVVRLADFNIKPGVKSDEGEGDDWPELRSRILDADILVLGTPVWLGQPSSIAKRTLERLNAFISEKDDGGRMPAYNRVAAVAVVGNEDGAHHISAELYQALNDVGFTLAPNAVCYWVGEAMGSKDFKDLPKVPDSVSDAAKVLARNTVHLARMLKEKGYPPVS